MSNNDMTYISQRDKQALEEALKELKLIEHGEEKVKDSYNLGQEIKKGIVITARPKAVTA